MPPCRSILVEASKESELGIMPDDPLIAPMWKYNNELVKAGGLDGSGPHPSSRGARVGALGLGAVAIALMFRPLGRLAAIRPNPTVAPFPRSPGRTATSLA
jgi:hypothetical protein